MSTVVNLSRPPAWDCLALGMQRALQVDRDAIFPHSELMPVSLPEMALVPYLGWIGPRFAGTVIVAKNPGGGGDSQSEIKQHDAEVAQALLTLKGSTSEQAGAALQQVYDAFTAQAPKIGMGTLLGRVLDALGEVREEVAFLNLCPFRTRMDTDPSAAAARRCGSLVLAPLVASLKADTVVLLGGFAARAAPALDSRWIYQVKRRINDYQLHPDASLRLDEMRASRGDRMTFRSAH